MRLFRIWSKKKVKKQPKVVETIKKLKDLPRYLKRRAIKEAKKIAEKNIADFDNSKDVSGFCTWAKTPSGYDFWDKVCEYSNENIC